MGKRLLFRPAPRLAGASRSALLRYRLRGEHWRRARVFVRDYRAIEPQAGDLVYADPPYFGTKNSTVYQRGGEDNAGEGWHTELHAKLMEWNARGAAVVTSNVNTPFIRELYAGWGAVEYSLHWVLGNKGRQNRGYEVALWRRGLARAQ